ncbi:cation:proton antiporter [Methanobrevibacter sp. DSM 116169]|uniref:cation:proton antiporter n=1 Tax=Methanobrevibacter sp. DSM 116169 TaxID=3242727 RepID=UPI0038FC8296
MESIIFNLGIILVLGIITIKLLNRLKVPSFLGFLLIGIVLGPFGLNMIDDAFLGLSQEISTLAIVILLIRAGLGLNRQAISKVGRPAVEMSCIPSIVEGLSVMVIAHYILGISFIEAGMLGFILASVSPAVLVPRMLDFIRRGYGTKKGIPSLLLAGSAADDVVAITIFSAFLGMYGGSNINVAGDIIGIPISIILGILIGAVFGLGILFIFKKWDFSSTEKLLIVLSIGILLNSFGELVENYIPVAGLVGVMVVGFLIVDKLPKIGKELSDKFSHIWFFAEIIVFCLLGAQIQLNIIPEIFVPGMIIITLGLGARAIGVFISLLGTGLNHKEKLFCMVSYIPKANAQATIGSLPLAAGVASGEIILAITGIAIIYTAPVGAILIEYFGPKLMSHDEAEETEEENEGVYA